MSATVGDNPIHVAFSDLDMAFDWIGSTPGTDIGLAVLNSASSATLCSAICVGTPLRRRPPKGGTEDLTLVAA